MEEGKRIKIRRQPLIRNEADVNSQQPSESAVCTREIIKTNVSW